jgi:hypothetical protein
VGQNEEPDTTKLNDGWGWEAVAPNTYRLPVEGGWLYKSVSGSSESMTYVPDPRRTVLMPPQIPYRVGRDTGPDGTLA